MKSITPDEAQKLVEQGEVVVIDVRTPAEFEGGHIGGAKNIDIQNPSFIEQMKSLDKNISYVVNCQLGGRSSRAVTAMNELGFKNAMNLEGGITAWKVEGRVVEK